VTVTAEGGDSVVTDPNGHYYLDRVYVWSGTVTVAKAGCTFSPPSVSYADVTADIPDRDYVATPSRVAAAKREREGNEITLSGVVTAVFGDVFYIEAADMSSGMRVEKAGHGMTPGMSALVTGFARTNSDFERYIDASDVLHDAGGNVAPLMLNNKYLGGGDFEYCSTTGAGQRGVEGGVGLNNIGLLAATFGRVTATGSDFFYIDDGTHATDASTFNGIRVLCGSLQKPELGKPVFITGISSITKIGDKVFRCIRPASQTCIQIMQ
jgi:hypothetical protein